MQVSLRSVGFSIKIGGAKGLNLPSILEETRVVDKYWKPLSITRVFHEKRCMRKSRLKRKSDFLIKKSSIWPLVSLLSLKICRLGGTWGAVCPSNSRYCLYLRLYMQAPVHAYMWILTNGYMAYLSD